MSRLGYSVLFAFSLSVLSLSAVGCGADNEVIEDTRPPADVDQEEADYEKMMEDTAASDVSE
jgi:hypothetical protein